MRSLFRTILPSTLRDIALVCVADSIVGLSFGAISVSGGLPLWFPVALSLLVFAGGAQFATIGVLLAGGDPLTAAITGLVLNGRLMAYGFAVNDVFGTSVLARLFGVHLVVDESVAFALQQRDPVQRQAAFWVAGGLLFTAWNVSVFIGAIVATSIGSTTLFGLDATFPALLFALVWPAFSDHALRRRAAIGSVLAVLGTTFLAPGLAVLLALGALMPSAWRTVRKVS